MSPAESQGCVFMSYAETPLLFIRLTLHMHIFQFIWNTCTFMQFTFQSANCVRNAKMWKSGIRRIFPVLSCPVWVIDSDSCSWMTGEEPDVVFHLQYAHHNYKKRLFKLLHFSWQLEFVWPFFSDICYERNTGVPNKMDSMYSCTIVATAYEFPLVPNIYLDCSLLY